MNCLYCSCSAPTQLLDNTSLVYHTFQCAPCKRKFNERPGTLNNHSQFPADVVSWLSCGGFAIS